MEKLSKTSPKEQIKERTKTQKKSKDKIYNSVITYTSGKVIADGSGIERVDDCFTPGIYTAGYDGNGFPTMFKLRSLELHTPFKSEVAMRVLSTIESFFKEDTFKKVNELGFIHKLGILLYGNPGTGKTALMNYAANMMIQLHGAVVFLCGDNNSLSAGYTIAKKLRHDQDNPVIFLCDEFEQYAKNAESTIKNMTDGNLSINNSLFLAATNYIEIVPDSLKKRASRFKVVEELKGIEVLKDALDIAQKICGKTTPQAITKARLKKIIEVPCTIDEIKHKILDEVLENSLPAGSIKKDTIGFKSGKITEEQREEEMKQIKTNQLLDTWHEKLIGLGETFGKVHIHRK